MPATVAPAGEPQEWIFPSDPPTPEEIAQIQEQQRQQGYSEQAIAELEESRQRRLKEPLPEPEPEEPEPVPAPDPVPVDAAKGPDLRNVPAWRRWEVQADFVHAQNLGRSRCPCRKCIGESAGAGKSAIDIEGIFDN
jgi:hypothetical protein